jgi:hypothetical protein
MELDSTFQNFVDFKPTALVFRDDMPYESWERLLYSLKYINSGVQWWIGDALAYGEPRFGQKFSQAIEASDMYTENGLAALKWVSEQVEGVRRRKEVSWSAHREVAALEPVQQDEVLEKAAADGLTVTEVRQAVRDIKNGLSGESTPEYRYEIKVSTVDDGEIIYNKSWVGGDNMIADLRQARLL